MWMWHSIEKSNFNYWIKQFWRIQHKPHVYKTIVKSNQKQIPTPPSFNGQILLSNRWSLLCYSESLYGSMFEVVPHLPGVMWVWPCYSMETQQQDIPLVNALFCWYGQTNSSTFYMMWQHWHFINSNIFFTSVLHV